jgi:hypothetical protein
MPRGSAERSSTMSRQWNEQELYALGWTILIASHVSSFVFGVLAGLALR